MNLVKNSSIRQMIFGLVSLLLAAALTGCTFQTTAPPSPEDIQTAIAQTESVKTTPTFPATFTPTHTPAPTNTPEPTPTPTPLGPISGKVNTDFLNMRSGPGTMFEIVQTFVLDTELSAIARSPDSSWIEVTVEFEDNEPLQGWMFTSLLDLNGDPTKLPTAEFEDSQTIYGMVSDTDGEPLDGIIITVVMQNDELDLSAEVTSDQDGKFEVYVPVITTEPFHVQIRTFACDSPVVNLNCLLDGYIIQNDEEFVFTPQDEAIEFVFEPTTLVLDGKVTDAKGVAVNGAVIQARRDDGSISYARSDALGDFELPIGEGIWDVYVITYNPFKEGNPIQVEVADEAPEPIELKMP